MNVSYKQEDLLYYCHYLVHDARYAIKLSEDIAM